MVMKIIFSIQVATTNLLILLHVNVTIFTFNLIQENILFVLFQNFLGFGQTADIDIVFDGAANRKMTDVKMEDGKKERQLLYYDGETVSGKVTKFIMI